MPKSNIALLKDAIGANKSASIIVHHNADPDAIGSAIAMARGMAQFGIKSDIYAPLGVSLQSKTLLEKYPYPIIESKERLKSIALSRLVFVIDSSSPEQIGNLEIPKDSALVIIDHHEEGALFSKAQIRFVDKSAHAAAFMVYSTLRNISAKITSEIAFFLLCGIVADTAFLRMIASKELRIASELLESAGIELDEIYAAISVPEDISERIAKLKSFKRMKAYRLGDTLVAFSSSGSFESQAALALVKSGADIAFVENVDEKKPEYRMSGRMRQGLLNKIDLSKLMKSIEPLIEGSAGGHPTAASANGKNAKNGKIAEETLLKLIENALGKTRKTIVE